MTLNPLPGYSSSRRPTWLPVVVVLACLISNPHHATAGPNATKLVVVLYPDESDGAPGIILTSHAIRETFADQPIGRIEVRNEYVDTSRNRDVAFMHSQVTLMRQKYSGRKVDLVIAGLSSGLDFALRYRAELFPGVPIVFVAVDQREIQSRRLPPDVLGVPIHMDLGQTLDLALRLHPNTRRVFVIAGRAPFDVEWSNEARKVFRGHEDRLEFVYLTGLPMDELQGRLGHLPDDSIIYYLSIHQDGAGKSTIPAEALEHLATSANAPIYSHVDTYVGRGIVGGHVFRFETEGTNAARLGLRILSGEKPETISVPETSANTSLFDWRQLRRWGIDEDSLPQGSIVLFRVPSVWDVYKWRIIGGISLCVVEALLIAGLLVQLVKRRRADARFRQVVETAPTGMLMIGRDGTIVMVNAQLLKLFGYLRDELIDQPVEQLVPERARDQHRADRVRFFAAPEVRRMGQGRDLLGLRKDGSEFPVEIGLSPIRTPRGLFVLATIVDLTELRRAESGLRARQQELQSLTRRLLRAQEAERRRIARELHDDLNQSLALLSVEMDLLAVAPPATPTEAANRVRALSGRVKELSSSVHDLSHQLHPSKLEQLGLVVAIRSLCKELSHSHNLNVKFTHYSEPVAIPPDVALCLYRIVQEALRNVVKHSGSRDAAVELSGTASAIHLRVIDDGTGFDPSSTRGGLGLVSMRERLHLVGGEIVIDSRPAGGTRIDVHVPLVALSPHDDIGTDTDPPTEGSL